MKKKYFSLLTAFISLLAIAVYVLLAILFIARVAGGKEFVPQVEKSFWLYEVIQRIGKVGFNMFFSIIGIIFPPKNTWSLPSRTRQQKVRFQGQCRIF